MSLLLIQKQQTKLVSLRRQKGVVIVVALFFVALVATLSYIMIARLDRDIRRTSLILHNTQAELYAQGSIAWALDSLQENFSKKKANKVVDELPLQSTLSDINGYKIQSTIEDAQDKFNINVLTSNQEVQQDFLRLLKAAIPDLKVEEAIALKDVVLEWINNQSDEAESSLTKYYLGLSMPYRSAHRAMASISELRLLKGMTPKRYLTLKKFLTALPETKPEINVQTAPLAVLLSLSPEMTTALAKEIIELRTKKPFTSINDMLSRPKLSQIKISKDKIVTMSHYFLVTTEVRVDEQRIILYTLIARIEKDGEAKHIIVWQSKNSPD